MADRRFRSTRPALFLVPAYEPATEVPTVAFCTHCGSRPDAQDVCGPSARVCGKCGLGLLLECRADAAPSAGGAFLVVDNSLSICAVSGAAEKLLAARETEFVNRHITEVLVPADSQASGENLAVAITWAARGEPAVRKVVVRPANTFGVRVCARIVSCGPPPAALMLLD